jgi:hypothetical protein
LQASDEGARAWPPSACTPSADVRLPALPAARRVKTSEVVKHSPAQKAKGKAGRRQAGAGGAQQQLQPVGQQGQAEEEQLNPVLCAACGEEVGLRVAAADGVYHFFNVVASNP